MKLIKNNPYRILGILAGTSTREQVKQVRRIKQFINVDQELEEAYTFPVLARFDRTIDMIIEAESKLNLDTDKINAALFWFVNGNIITDEPAFDSLKDSDEKSCVEIWEKRIGNYEVTKSNWSAFHNLSTLLINN